MCGNKNVEIVFCIYIFCWTPSRQRRAFINGFHGTSINRIVAVDPRGGNVRSDGKKSVKRFFFLKKRLLLFFSVYRPIQGHVYHGMKCRRRRRMSIEKHTALHSRVYVTHTATLIRVTFRNSLNAPPHPSTRRTSRRT